MTVGFTNTQIKIQNCRRDHCSNINVFVLCVQTVTTSFFFVNDVYKPAFFLIDF